jgi:hypothetical protein
MINLADQEDLWLHALHIDILDAIYVGYESGCFWVFLKGSAGRVEVIG